MSASRVVGLMRAFARIARRMLGAPDYEAYVHHVRSAHPEREPMGREEFFAERLVARYSRPGARCC